MHNYNINGVDTLGNYVSSNSFNKQNYLLIRKFIAKYLIKYLKYLIQWLQVNSVADYY